MTNTLSMLKMDPCAATDLRLLEHEQHIPNLGPTHKMRALSSSLNTRILRYNNQYITPKGTRIWHFLLHSTPLPSMQAQYEVTIPHQSTTQLRIKKALSLRPQTGRMALHQEVTLEDRRLRNIQVVSSLCPLRRPYQMKTMHLPHRTGGIQRIWDIRTITGTPHPAHYHPFLSQHLMQQCPLAPLRARARYVKGHRHRALRCNHHHKNLHLHLPTHATILLLLCLKTRWITRVMTPSETLQP